MANEYAEKKQAAIEAVSRAKGVDVLGKLQGLTELALANGDRQTAANALVEQIQLSSHFDHFPAMLGALRQLHDLYVRDAAFAFARDDVLWYHKWVIARLTEFTAISRETIEEAFGKFEALLKAENMSLRASYSLRCSAACDMGRMEEARAYYKKWQSAKTSSNDDCPACDLNSKIAYLLHNEKAQEAIEAAVPMFEGKLTCDEEPARTYARLLAPALKMELYDLAEELHKATLRFCRLKPDMTTDLSRHLIYRTMTGRARQSRRIATILLGRAGNRRAKRAGSGETMSDYTRFAVNFSCAMWFAALAHEGIGRVKLPREFEPAAGEREVTVPAGAAYCFEQARGIAERFDARNGTRHYGEYLENLETIIRALCSSGPHR